MRLQLLKSTRFKLVSFTVFFLSAMIIISCGDDDDGSVDPVVSEFIRITVLDPNQESITIQNLGTSEVDITNFQLCLGPGQYNILSNYSSIDGDLSLSANEAVIIDLTSGSSGVTALPDSNGGLGLFSTGGQFESSDPAILRDYVQWGAADQNRVDQAVTAERWNDASSFISGFAPYTFSGSSNEFGSNFWNTVAPEDVRLKSGFVINLATPNNDRLVKYFSTLPSGTADLSDGQVFSQFSPRDAFDGNLFTSKTDGTGAFTKMAVNGNGLLVEDGEITLSDDDNSFLIKVINDTTGLFHDRANSTEISVFNPTTMELEGIIDMSAGTAPSPQRFQEFVIRGDEVYAPIRAADGNSYDNYIVQIANYQTGQYVGQTEFPTGANSFVNIFGQNWVDDAGNIWFQNAGSPLEGNFISSIHRVPAGSQQFDSYSFIPALAANPANTLFPQTGRVYFLGNNLAIALVITDVPQGVIDLLASVGGDPANLSEEQIDLALGLFFTEETGRWVELDLEAQTATIIAGLPAQGGFAVTSVEEINGLVYLSITRATENAFYTYNVTTKEVEKAFDVVGGSIDGIYDLSKNN